MKFEKLKFSEIRNKYFYRTEKWDWLSKEMIHVIDSKNPRMITMDSWPQKIFLEALGGLTISEYIDKVSMEYPKSQVPKGLDELILELLDSLINKERIIALSDVPIIIDKSVLNPLTQEGEIDIQGIWTGTYKYNLPEGYKDKTLIDVSFTITVEEVKGNSFSGTIKDDLETGGTPGLGNIKGNFSEDGIRFDKKMPISSIIDDAGRRVINEKRKHPTIIYEGDFSRSKKCITGIWKFKKRVWFWKGMLPYRASVVNGTFTMNKK